jgi:hypothetical protein
MNIKILPNCSKYTNSSTVEKVRLRICTSQIIYCTDESLTMWKGHPSFNQHTHLKAATFGIKSYKLCLYHTGCLTFHNSHKTRHEMREQYLNSDKSETAAIVSKLVKHLLDHKHRCRHTCMHTGTRMNMHV